MSLETVSTPASGIDALVSTETGWSLPNFAAIDSLPISVCLTSYDRGSEAFKSTSAGDRWPDQSRDAARSHWRDIQAGGDRGGASHDGGEQGRGKSSGVAAVPGPSSSNGVVGSAACFPMLYMVSSSHRLLVGFPSLASSSVWWAVIVLRTA